MNYVFIIQYNVAVDSYREAIATWKNYESDYECDRLQVHL